MSANRSLRQRAEACAGTPALRRAAAVLLACAACLAGVGRATAQGFAVSPPTLRNEAEIRREATARHSAVLGDSALGGTVYLKLRVLADGTLDPATISVERAGNPALAGAALAIARMMRFAPGRVGGTPAAVWYRYPLFFESRASAAEEAGSYELFAIEVPPRLRNRDRIAREIGERYPPERLNTLTPGDVLVRLKVLETGAVDPASVVAEVSTDTAFEGPAVAVIREMRFTPALIGDLPVSVWITIPIHFEVQGDPPADSAATPAGPVSPPPTPGRPSGPVTRRDGAAPFAGRHVNAGCPRPTGAWA